MLTREQMHALAKVKYSQSGSHFFSPLPLELIHAICDVPEDPNSDIAKALHHAAYARKEDVEALLALLDANPRLLLQAGNVVTPGGDKIERVTPYEFLLGAGDYELAEKVQGYFSKIKNDEGEKIDAEGERIRQYERYKSHIEGMLTEKPYDLKPLIELIKKATPQEITALLNKDMSGENELCKAMLQFRQDWAPKVLTKPGMHYNYASLQHAFKTLEDEWEDLYQASGNNYDKINLVWRQLIGFEMRRLPGIDRCIMAQGLYYVIEKNEAIVRSYSFKNDAGVEFPITCVDDSLGGLGGDFSVGIFGSDDARPRIPPTLAVRLSFSDSLENFCRTKTSNLQNLCSYIHHSCRA